MGSAALIRGDFFSVVVIASGARYDKDNEEHNVSLKRVEWK